MPQHEQSKVPSSPEIHFPPPLFFAIAAVAGILLNKSFPLGLASGWTRMIFAPAGYLLMAGALVMGVWAVVTFVHLRTGIFPHQPAKQLVNVGPYRFSRNPMYLSLNLGYVGFSLLLNSVWMLVFLPIALLALHRFIIRREERYLAVRFGDDYRAYCGRVRRWI